MENKSQVKMFVSGIVAGVLVLCTIGFFILLAVVVKGEGFDFGGSAKMADNNVVVPTGNAPTENLNVPAVDEKNDHIKGGKNAKVTLIEYSDFECPFCGRFYPTLKQALSEYGDDIRVVYRHFPLSFHPEALPAAEASECADEQGKFWEFHDGVFENQDRIGSALYTEVAGKLGLNITKFNDCVSSGKYRSKIQQQQLGGQNGGVSGTPATVVIGQNGKSVSVSGAQPYSSLKAAIDSVL